MKVGDVVTYVDHQGYEHNALVTAVWGPEIYDQDPPSLNLVFIDRDESKKDPYGRQIARDTSVPHAKNQKAHGNYWEEA